MQQHERIICTGRTCGTGCSLVIIDKFILTITHIIMKVNNFGAAQFWKMHYRDIANHKTTVAHFVVHFKFCEYLNDVIYTSDNAYIYWFILVEWNCKVRLWVESCTLDMGSCFFFTLIITGVGDLHRIWPKTKRCIYVCNFWWFRGTNLWNKCNLGQNKHV